MQAALKKIKVKLDFLSGIKGEICHSIYRCEKANKKCMKENEKKKKIVISSILEYRYFIWLGNVAKGSGI